MTSMRVRVSGFVRSLQNEIVAALESLDPEGPKFVRDSWTRPEGGSGISCVLQGTDKPRDMPSFAPPFAPLEKAGVNISIINGRLPPAAIAHMRADHAGLPAHTRDIPPDGVPFFVAGLSLVIHPRSPHAPTVHANWRYFELVEAGVDPNDESIDRKPMAWWFGGGSDLTPSYLYEEDCVHFHKTIQEACLPYGKDLYNIMKIWCDEYFYIPHRKEARGIGGVFFDDLSSHTHQRLDVHADPTPRPRSAEECFALIQSLGKSFVPSYLPILQRRAHLPWTDEERRWQLIRRGRYVEFNLVVDRGTKFGLQTPSARIESILMTLPETARWEYMSDMGAQSRTREAQLLEVLTTPKNWVNV